MGITMTVMGRLGTPERPSFLSRRAHLLTTSSSQAPYPSTCRKAAGLAHSAAPPLPTKQALRGPLFGGGIPPFGRVVRSARRIALSAENARQCRRACGLRSSLPVRLADGCRLICIFAANRCPPSGATCHPPAKTCHCTRHALRVRQLSRRDGRCHPAPSIFFCMRQKKQKRLPAGSRKDVIHYGDLSPGSKGHKPWGGPLRLRGFRLSELFRHLQRL